MKACICFGMSLLIWAPMCAQSFKASGQFSSTGSMSIVSGGLPSYSGSPTYLTAITYPATPPSVGGITGAGDTFTDPVFGTQGVRVTDAIFDPSMTGNANNNYSVSNGGSGDDSGFNTNSTLFFVTNDGGIRYVVKLNPATLQVSRLYAGVTTGNCPLNGGNCSVRGGWADAGALVFSVANPYTLYVSQTSSTEIDSYTFDGPSYSLPPPMVKVGDFQEDAPAGCAGTACNCLPANFGTPTWVSDGGVGAGDAVFARTFASSAYNYGGTGQNDAIYVGVYSPTKGCMMMNTQTGVIHADLGWGGGAGLTCSSTQCSGTSTAAAGFAIHNVKLNRAGNRLVIQWGGCITGTCYSSTPFIWAFADAGGNGSNVVYVSETVAGHRSGHWSAGSLGFVNDPGAITGQFNYWLTSATGAPGTYSVVNNVPSPNCAYNGTDEHTGWQMDNATDTMPFGLEITTISLQTWGLFPFDQPPANCPWWGELDLVDMNGDGLVHREALTFNSSYHSSFNVNNDIAIWSQDGQFVAVGSDWFNTLRNATGTSSSCIPNGPKWQASRARALNYILTPGTTNNPNRYSFKAMVAGSSGTTEPTWSTSCGSYGQTCGDGTVTWTNIGQPSTNQCGADVFLWKLQ
ncbi:MAG TPA: hypothetical protein VFO39_19370 [Candidatus Sulfotelmatobacter sp.]|nr:hypothetical protein [Candidatus Sulfotelmatobacter sp.]